MLRVELVGLLHDALICIAHLLDLLLGHSSSLLGRLVFRGHLDGSAGSATGGILQLEGRSCKEQEMAAVTLEAAAVTGLRCRKV